MLASPYVLDEDKVANDPPYRIFKSRPLPSFAEQVRAQIREHGSPEFISELRHSAIDKDEYFEILAEIDIDGRTQEASGRAGAVPHVST